MTRVVSGVIGMFFRVGSSPSSERLWNTDLENEGVVPCLTTTLLHSYRLQGVKMNVEHVHAQLYVCNWSYRHVFKPSWYVTVLPDFALVWCCAWIVSECFLARRNLPLSLYNCELLHIYRSLSITVIINEMCDLWVYGALCLWVGLYVYNSNLIYTFTRYRVKTIKMV